MKTTLSLLALLAVLPSVPAFADHHEGGHDKDGKPGMEAAHEGACKADLEKFCKDVTPGEGRKIACLKAHSDKLSSECKAQGEKMKERRKEMHAGMEACKADKEKFCKDVEMGGGKMKECMKSHEAELSAGCRDMMAKMREHHGKGRGMGKGQDKGMSDKPAGAPAEPAKK
jgi:hypothetical protein